MHSSLDLQILATLAYSDQFCFPLSEKEIYQRLVAKQVVVRGGDYKLVTTSIFTKKLANFVNMGLIYQHKNYFGLKVGYKDLSTFENAVFTRANKRLASLAIKKEAQPLLKFCIKIPWILAVGVTGAVAVENASVEDDLDLLIVTRAGRLWLTRIILLIFSLLKGKKAIFRKQNIDSAHKDSWCFNLWFEEEYLTISKSRHNLFSAYEVMQVDWLFDRGSIEQEFISENIWIKEYLVSGATGKNFANITKQTRNPNHFFSVLNRVVYFIEKTHLSKNNLIPQKNLTLTQAWMHDSSSFTQYLRGYKSLLKQSLSANFQ